MTSPGSPPPPDSGPPDERSPLEPLTPTEPPIPLIATPSPASGPPGASTFTIEGRAAPALFVIGWLASLMGLGVILVGAMSGVGLTSTLLRLSGFLLLAVGLVAASGSQGLDRRARGLLPYRGPSPFLVFAAAIPISAIAISLASIPMDAVGISVLSPAGAVIALALQASIYVGLIRLLVVDVGALSWGEMGVRRLGPSALSDMAHGALWAVPVIGVTIPVAAILGTLFTVTPESPLAPAGETSGFVLNLIAGAILAPLGEELLFRGLATTAWVRGMGARRGIVRGALFFAFVHILTISGDTAGEALQLAIIGFATRLPVALALGYLFMKRGSIWVAFGLHAAFNGILLVLAEIALRSGVAGAG